MKKLSATLFILFISITLFAQDSTQVSKEEYSAARESMKDVESALLRENSDAIAVQLINKAKEAGFASKNYMGRSQDIRSLY
ncbi:MAG: hypothetical protein ACI837_000654 [Crocinitomicaceae bacterium]|jgi:hypothetical protein